MESNSVSGRGVQSSNEITNCNHRKSIRGEIHFLARTQLFDGGKMEKIFDGQKKAKLGTAKNPAVVRVKTKKRSKEVASIFEKNGWSYKIELDRKKAEDIGDLELLLNPAQPVIAGDKVGRNEPCPCGSGKKYKKCCSK